ncbi:hypothetical protein M409DRAFT_29004 [Zasmidium cellare ATCC 36951]|uniref:Carbohydrate-binding module family 52 protein n=1 Tax=Zasmidium cellare ATCC 36951 TaxID=1080233 RepID=A0A6A6C5F6_ZASCE|nr:uncharacterized protein M409DRAFT_29004 [Zasmidium cellare ATCC 36951]KAF2160616.1 hypothetical protein M409DRAFT_29004 [Zasmidium cellare ATCC 36951]
MLKRPALSFLVGVISAQQQCYYAPGGQYRGPDNLVPCNSTGASSCCLLGDTCLSGNTCYNPNTGNLYQYGCTDITYNDETCPYKCGFDPDKSPWTALEYCTDIQDLTNTWICHGPESSGFAWPAPSQDLLVLQPRGCRDMGNLALVALYAPSKLAPYVSLPSTFGGMETAVPGYAPESFTQLTTYRPAPRSGVWVDAEATPGTGTYAAARSWTGRAPTVSAEGTGSGESSGNATVTATGSAGPILQSGTSLAAAGAGLSTGAKAGIGVGVAGGVLLLAALGMCLFCFGRKRSRRDRADQQQQRQQQYPQSPPQTQMTTHIPPYPSPPPHPQMHWTPIQSGPPLMDPASGHEYGHGGGAASSPHQNQISRSVSRGKVENPQTEGMPPVPVVPLELEGEELRRSLYEMEARGEGEEEGRKRGEMGMGMGTGMGNAF